MSIEKLLAGLVIGIALFLGGERLTAQDYFAATGGWWSAPETWTTSEVPPPGANVFIGNEYSGALSANVILDTSVVLNDLFIGLGSGAIGYLDMNGSIVTAENVYLGANGGNGTLLQSTGILHANRMYLENGSFVCGPADTIQNLQIGSGASVTTYQIANLPGSVRVISQSGGPAVLDLGGDLRSVELEVVGSATSLAVVEANGQNIMVDYIRLASFGEIRNHNSLAAVAMEIDSTAFSFKSADSTAFLLVDIGAHVSTSGSNNIIDSVQVLEANSRLDLGADLILQGRVQIAGSGATIDAHGWGISCSELKIGNDFVNGALNNLGWLDVHQLALDRSSDLFLSGSNDIVRSSLFIGESARLVVDQYINPDASLTLDGESLRMDSNALLVLSFDGFPERQDSGFDWAFRWANNLVTGDRIEELQQLLDDGKIQVSAPFDVSIFTRGDGYTYIGFQSIPEPTGMLFGGCVVIVGMISARRARRR